jgi:hypothetical protein
MRKIDRYIKFESKGVLSRVSDYIRGFGLEIGFIEHF